MFNSVSRKKGETIDERLCFVGKSRNQPQLAPSRIKFTHMLFAQRVDKYLKSLLSNGYNLFHFLSLQTV